ncbi:MAG: hypothetical protein CM15mP111_4120 [Hyphomicrobiales bacterium]|nr:MAG: hypothetical protein CM15mP111_4120 [Hyphomicrobiales bacterium]
MIRIEKRRGAIPKKGGWGGDAGTIYANRRKFLSEKLHLRENANVRRLGVLQLMCGIECY